MRQRLLASLASIRLQRILVLGFILTTTVTILVGTPITYGVINRYLAGARDDRLARDMKLAEAFYDLKMGDLASAARRVSASPAVRDNVAAARARDPGAAHALRQQLESEFSILSADTHRFIVIVDRQGTAIDGLVSSSSGRTGLFRVNTNWSQVPIIRSTLAEGTLYVAPEIVPEGVLEWLGLAEQARIELIDTPQENPTPFDPREGTAGLVLMAVAPVASSAPGEEMVGAVVIGHLFNNDNTLVDRIKEVAGVDTATMFLGDLRVSTNVPDVKGERAIGTRVSQQVYDTVLVQGQGYTGRALVVNEWYITRYQPLRDHAGAVIGSLYVGAKEASFVQLVDSFRRWLVLIAGASIAVATATAVPIAWSISRPLAEVADATHKVAEGDWSVRVPVYGHADMGTLGASFNTMVETLRDTHDRLVQKEKLASLGQLAAGVAHEINNPLGSVLLYADILCREPPSENEQWREDLAMITREATRCKTIVTNLLNFSRQNEVLSQTTDVGTLIRTIVEEVKAKPEYARIAFTVEIDPALPEIEADPLQLRQAFVNLMNNGAEAMTSGGKLMLRARPGPNAGWITIEIEDTGSGISKENMTKLFTPFFTTKPIGKGTGLGLAITYGIVKMHQGQIVVQSEVGVGTKFVITLREKLQTRSTSGLLG